MSHQFNNHVPAVTKLLTAVFPALAKKGLSKSADGKLLVVIYNSGEEAGSVVKMRERTAIVKLPTDSVSGVIYEVNK